MPFVQRVVQPVNLAQANGIASGKLKFRCIPGKCKNNNCINRLQNNINNIDCVDSEVNNTNANTKDTIATAAVAGKQQTQQQQTKTTVIKAIVHTTTLELESSSPSLVEQPQQQQQYTTTQLNGGDNFATSPLLPPTYNSKRAGAPLLHGSNLTNGFAASFTYATDTEEDIVVASAHSTATATTPLSPSSSALRSPTILPNMKKLKQHVEFLDTAGSTPTSPTRSLSRSSAPGGFGGGAGAGGGGGSASSSRATSRERSRRSVTAANSPTSAKIVTGFEFDSISNITLSNALRQLASLVLIASDIFEDLQSELQQVGERARVVQRKIVAVEKRVYSYDPKKVTVPESDLFTFAQRKTHYDCDKACRQELFTAATRPQSVRVLYEDAGKKTPPPTPAPGTAASTPRSTSFTSADGLLNCDDGVELDATMLDNDINNDTGAGNSMAAGSDELVCTPVFGKATRKMRTRIDAEIEIRLPAAIEDLRKWTSSEALGDVTVTPDCMHHVDTSISTSIVIGDNGVLTPALSPSVLSADAVDALYSINVSNAVDSAHIPNDLNKDVPLNHRLPSPEEQCKIIALRYPAEVISVDTSGKRFERMCLARKSTTGCYNHHPTPSMGQGSSAGSSAADGSSTTNNNNNLNEDIQTVSRRSRSRKVRGKRRNTIAGTDQKEIQSAANGDSTITSIGEIQRQNTTSGINEDAKQRAGSSSGSRQQHDKSKKFGRSKSSDILKKESVALPYDKGKNTLTRLNSLKQWGRNRFKFMQRNDASSVWVTGGGSGIIGGAHDGVKSPNASAIENHQQHDALATCSNSSHSPNTSIEKAESTTTTSTTTTSHSSATLSTKTCSTKTVSSGRGTMVNDDECNVHDELSSQKSEARFSHERKPSYSSSEKSMSVSSTGHLRGKLHLAASCSSSNHAAVKLRDTASLNRQRRNGISTNGYGGKEEQPHSSSGNWSASSESGRASIGSEITMQPKSSASNTSLNVSSFHPSSGPPSSMMSRRRFLNTSASSSVTSEGTATPELHDGAYPNHLDDETSSAYSCDTEGYYTSFHMDSGLRTLKEEEPTLTPLQQQIQTSNYSFGSQSNQTVLSAENEYELFGRGSTSTTTSSAGTVCTTLMLNGSVGEHSSLNNLGPDVPERVSSLSKQSNSSLERSYSSSTIGSTLERTGTIKRNTNASGGLKLVTSNENEIENDLNGPQQPLSETPESQEAEFNFKREEQQPQQQRLRKRAAQPLPEIECSESSDLECVERIERIKHKTAINARRIPSMCIITPTTSDDENPNNANDDATSEKAYDPNRTLTNEEETELSAMSNVNNESQQHMKFKLNEATGYCTVEKQETAPTPKQDCNLNNLPNNNQTNGFFEKLKVVLPSIKRTMPGKSSTKHQPANSVDVLNNDELYDTGGEYVTIADISNNNRRQNQLTTVAPKSFVGGASSSLGIYYSNDIVRRGQQQQHQQQQQQQQGNEPKIRETEYISLNDLPLHLRKRVVLPPTSSSSLTSSASSTQNATLSSASKEQQVCAAADWQRERNNFKSYDEVNNHNDDGGLVSMYAEISEIRDSSSSPTTAAANNNSSQSQHKGPRVRVNSQGKFIYDSDSLKRRKGAHTTFAPGPFVKETESALPDIPISESLDNTNSCNNIGKIAKTTAAAKLLFLNGGPAATRKVANVRPIVSRTPTRIATPTSNMPATTTYQQQQQQQQQHAAYNAFIQQQPSQQQQHQIAALDQKNLLANNTNPFFQPAAVPISTNLGPAMMPSPSTKSTSSTGSTISSSASTHTSGSTSSTEEGYQRFYRPNEKPTAQALQYQNQNYGNNAQQQTLAAVKKADNGEATAARNAAAASPFQRNAPIYWTLQNRRQTKLQPSSVTCRDDLYATPIRRSERMARAAALQATTGSNSSSNSQNISPIVPRGGGFSTSTPTKAEENATERLNICADRIGQSKTSLMDFKKLLLAKSAKTSPIQKKLSAVELLKKKEASNAGAGAVVQPNTAAGVGGQAQQQQLNSSMKLLDLSGSPKTFANRRMLRQGQFGSPSKTFVPKIKTNSAAAWRNNNIVPRTDIMSTTIPEANSEEDHSNTSGGSNSSRASSIVRDDVEATSAAEPVDPTTLSYDMKRNLFVQADENNFMRSEFKQQQNFGRNSNNNSPKPPVAQNTMPALETAL